MVGQEMHKEKKRNKENVPTMEKKINKDRFIEERREFKVFLKEIQKEKKSIRGRRDEEHEKRSRSLKIHKQEKGQKGMI